MLFLETFSYIQTTATLCTNLQPSTP